MNHSTKIVDILQKKIGPKFGRCFKKASRKGKYGLNVRKHGAKAK